MKDAIEILSLFNAIEPSAIALVKTFLQDLSGKTKEQIIADADATWQRVIDTANAELQKTQSSS